jgi:hypothetical protein
MSTSTKTKQNWRFQFFGRQLKHLQISRQDIISGFLMEGKPNIWLATALTLVLPPFRKKFKPEMRSSHTFFAR